MQQADPAVSAQPKGRYLMVLSLSALGVVYGDIGTSPLYAIRECFLRPARDRRPPRRTCWGCFP